MEDSNVTKLVGDRGLSRVSIGSDQTGSLLDAIMEKLKMISNIATGSIKSFRVLASDQVVAAS